MKGIRNTDKNTRKYITISDLSLWDKIDEIMTLPKYEKSFNKVINEALFIGIPKLYSSIFNTDTEEEEQEAKPKSVQEDIIGDRMLKIIRLFKEVIINAVVNKSLICSLFNLEEERLNGTATGTQLSKGYYQNTPNFLANYEIRELRKLRD